LDDDSIVFFIDVVVDAAAASVVVGKDSDVRGIKDWMVVDRFIEVTLRFNFVFDILALFIILHLLKAMPTMLKFDFWVSFIF